VIFYDETLRQKTSSGCRSPCTSSSGRIAGHQGGIPARKRWPAFPNETITEGLDGCANG